MAVVDVEVPSGYIYTGWRFADEFVSVTLPIETAAMSYMYIMFVQADNAEVERVESRGANVIFYFESVS